ncbi:glycoside hydrolase family 75 protein [Vibrio parahaemolyticus]
MKSIKLAFIMMLLVGCSYSLTSNSKNSVTSSDVSAHSDIKPEHEIIKNASALAAPAAIASIECLFEPWTEYKEDRLLSHTTEPAYIFATSHKAVDADGAPNAYHPKNEGLDYLANAGYPNKSWWRSVLVEDPKNPGRAYQQLDGPFEGYFVSKTSLQDNSKDEIDTSRYVDATSIPYLVFPGAFYMSKGTGRLGDLGYAFNVDTGDASPFVIADIGPRKAKLGEMSIALAEALGGKNVSPRNGRGLPAGKIMYVVFPYSSKNNPWPLINEQIKKKSDELLESVGGRNSLVTCVNKL